jgi:hypothetical protein
MWIKLPNEVEAWCRPCTCGSTDKTHTVLCEFYVDYAAALTDLIYDDMDDEPVKNLTQLN